MDGCIDYRLAVPLAEGNVAHLDNSRIQYVMTLNPHKLFVTISSGFAILLNTLPVVQAEPPVAVNFHKQVLPLLVERCSKCHSEDVRIAGLSLTTAVGIEKGSQNGPVVIPKNADESLLYKRLRLEQMPPGGEGKLFDKKELELIRIWIDAGATMKDVRRRSSF